MASYFGGRRPEDGVIDWSHDAASIHNLVRAVAPPYPGAITRIGDRPARILRTRSCPTPTSRPSMRRGCDVDGDRMLAHCGGGGTLQVLELEIDGVRLDARALAALRRARIALGGGSRCCTSASGTTPRREGFGKNRIEALADGIFAVAMTLLVLEIKLPPSEIYATDAALWQRLLSLEGTRHDLRDQLPGARHVLGEPSLPVPLRGAHRPCAALDQSACSCSR